MSVKKFDLKQCLANGGKCNFIEKEESYPCLIVYDRFNNGLDDKLVGIITYRSGDNTVRLFNTAGILSGASFGCLENLPKTHDLFVYLKKGPGSLIYSDVSDTHQLQTQMVLASKKITLTEGEFIDNGILQDQSRILDEKE